MKKRHIDEIQPSTVDKHLELLLEDESEIDLTPTEASPDDLPDWYDEKLFKIGQNFYKKNMIQMTLSSFVGLLAIIAVPQTLKMLLFTKQSSIPCIATSRYIQTVLHIRNMYTCDPSDPDSNWYKTIDVSRWKHKVASKRAKEAGIGGIYNRDMAITQFAFIGYVFITPRSIGLQCTEKEYEALNHFWRVMGRMLEIPDRLNICRKTVAETRELCQKLCYSNIAKYLNEAPSEFYEMVKVIINGLWYIDVTLNYDAFLMFTYRLHGIKYKTPLGWYSRLNEAYRDFMCYLYCVPYVGAVVRAIFNYWFIFVLWLIQNYPLHVWMKYGINNFRIKLYPKYK